MATLYVIEFLIGCAVLHLVSFQIVVPILTGTPLFPAFRAKKRNVVNTLIETEEEVEIAQIEKTTAEMKHTADAIRSAFTPKEEPDGFTKPDAGPPEPVPNEDLPRSS